VTIENINRRMLEMINRMKIIEMGLNDSKAILKKTNVNPHKNMVKTIPA